MTKYLQTNEQGYIVSLTDEPLLVGLFGGNIKNYREILDDEAEDIQAMLKECHSKGRGLHIDDL